MNMNSRFGTAQQLSEFQNFLSAPRILKLKDLIIEQTDPPSKYDSLSTAAKTAWKAAVSKKYEYANGVDNETAKKMWNNEEGRADYDSDKKSFWNKFNGLPTDVASDSTATTNDPINLQDTGNNPFDGSSGEEEDETLFFGYPLGTWAWFAILIFFLIWAISSIFGKLYKFAGAIAKFLTWLEDNVGIPAKELFKKVQSNSKAVWAWFIKTKAYPFNRKTNNAVREFFSQDLDTLQSKLADSKVSFASEIAEILKLAKNPVVFTKVYANAISSAKQMFQAGIIDKKYLQKFMSEAEFAKIEKSLDEFIERTNNKLRQQTGVKTSDHWFNAIKG